MSENPDFVFDLTPAFIPVILGTDLKGKPRRCQLREASEDAACKYRNALLRATKLGPDGKPTSIDGMADADPILVQGCLFEEYEHQGEIRYRQFVLKQILEMPARVIKTLCDQAKKMSKIDEGEDTVEALEKRREEIQERIDKLREAEANGKTVEGSSKNLPSSTTGTSGSPTNSDSH